MPEDWVRWAGIVLLAVAVLAILWRGLSPPLPKPDWLEFEVRLRKRTASVAVAAILALLFVNLWLPGVAIFGAVAGALIALRLFGHLLPIVGGFFNSKTKEPWFAENGDVYGNDIVLVVIGFALAGWLLSLAA